LRNNFKGLRDNFGRRLNTRWRGRLDRRRWCDDFFRGRGRFSRNLGARRHRHDEFARELRRRGPLLAQTPLHQDLDENQSRTANDTEGGDYQRIGYSRIHC
jgi:hypothetical protein